MSSIGISERISVASSSSTVSKTLAACSGLTSLTRRTVSPPPLVLSVPEPPTAAALAPSSVARSHAFPLSSMVAVYSWLPEVTVGSLGSIAAPSLWVMVNACIVAGRVAWMLSSLSASTTSPMLLALLEAISNSEASAWSQRSPTLTHLLNSKTTTPSSARFPWEEMRSRAMGRAEAALAPRSSDPVVCPCSFLPPTLPSSSRSSALSCSLRPLKSRSWECCGRRTL
mmetsp:Transcript_7511/g.27245  ORF Transcript_7511/g.27245 Transcript_7511/m.27245 type:complete len:227 (+) Transcript_7511:1070-1750(+)